MKLKRTVITVVLVVMIVVLSLVSVNLWGGKPEVLEHYDIQINSGEMTAAQIAKANNIPLKPVIKALGIDSSQAKSATLASINMTPESASVKVRRMMVQYDESRTKNWTKIFIKFALWLSLMIIPFLLLLNKKITPRRRRLLIGLGVLIFGIILGADPSPMGTVKDAVFLITAHGTVFWPRMVALAIFLLTVVLANKFICSWGCQFGLLQEFIFRLFRRRQDKRGFIRQLKPPFWLTNSVRIGVFAFAVLAGLLWALDVIGLIDPFKIFNPASIMIASGVFILFLLVLSPFIYRPWCHFFCPFGLLSWLFEKLSIFRIKVNYYECDACDACAVTCPSTVMSAILKKDKTVPDCFACGTCIETCPTKAISFTANRTFQGTYEDSLEIRAKKKLERKSKRHSE